MGKIYSFRNQRAFKYGTNFFNIIKTGNGMFKKILSESVKACLGYGTEVPKTSEDIICTIFSIMVGATFFALFVGNLSSILINVDVSQKKYAEVLTQVSRRKT